MGTDGWKKKFTPTATLAYAELRHNRSAAHHASMPPWRKRLRSRRTESQRRQFFRLIAGQTARRHPVQMPGNHCQGFSRRQVLAGTWRLGKPQSACSSRDGRVC